MNCEPSQRETDSVPVVLLHGFKDDARKMEPLARYLRAQGLEAYPVTVSPSWGQAGLETLATQLKSAIDDRFGPERPIDLVGFSMGGLVSRYYLQRLGGLERVRRFVTLSTPHRGSLLACLSREPACRQMRPGSAFLSDLDRDAARLADTGFVSFWTPLDLMILPAASSVVPWADNRRIWSLAHPLMVLERRILRAVAGALEEPAPVFPL